MVAEEDRPLAIRRQVGGLAHDIGDRRAVLAAQRHPDARHQREVEGHVALVVVAEVGPHVLGPLVRLGQDEPRRPALIHEGAQPLQENMGLRQILAVGPLALEEVGHRVEPQPIHAHVEPEGDEIEDLLLHARVVIIQVGLMVEEAVPEESVGFLVPGPVGAFGVGEDDPRVGVALVGVAPDVIIAVRRSGVLARLLEPVVLVRGVVHDQFGDHPQPALMGLFQEFLEVVERAVIGVDRPEIGDVVAAIAQRRAVEGQHPDAIHAERLDVVELAGQPPEVARAVVRGIEERADADLVDDRVLVPVVGGRAIDARREGLHCTFHGHTPRVGDVTRPPFVK